MQVLADTTECGNTVLALSGRLDLSCVADVRLVLHDAVDDGEGDLILDLADVQVTDATGLGLLVAVHRRADRAGRRLVLRHVPPRLARLLQVTKLGRILHTDYSVPLGLAPGLSARAS